MPIARHDNVDTEPVLFIKTHGKLKNEYSKNKHMGHLVETE
jgi:hypothetical protein